MDGLLTELPLSLVMTVPEQARSYNLTINQPDSATASGACLTTPDLAEMDYEEIDTVPQVASHLDPDLAQPRPDISPRSNITLGSQVLVLLGLMRDDIIYGLHNHPVPVAIAALSGFLIGFVMGLSLGYCCGLQPQAPASTNTRFTDDLQVLADSTLDPAPLNIPLAPLALAEESLSCSTIASVPRVLGSPSIPEAIFSPRPSLPRALPSFDRDLSVFMESFTATLSLNNTAAPSPGSPSSATSSSGETSINMSGVRETSV